MMMLDILFWILVAVDAAVLGLFFLLGLAAAGPSHTSPVSVTAFMLMPALVLTACILMFVRANSAGWRVAAVVLAASPAIVVVCGRGFAEWELRGLRNADGTWHSFRAGPLRDLQTAIAQNDIPAIAALAKRVNVNQAGLAGVTPLLLAISQLEKSPTEFGALKTLLEAGADVNATNGELLPLVAAIRVSREAGLEPVRMLLKAGAQPNQRDEWGTPAYLDACGTADAEVLKLLLDSGADLGATDRSGNGALMGAANVGNWKAVMLLLERGADWRKVKTTGGFLARLESDARQSGDGNGLAEVIQFVRTASGQENSK